MHSELGVIKLTDIELGERFRKDYGDINELASDIKEKGLICPIAVCKQDEGEGFPYRLAAGGRRYAAHLFLELDEIKCRIYPNGLTKRQLRAIELAENVKRKDLHWLEKDKLCKEIDELWKADLGEKTSTSENAAGHSMRDTAALMNMNISTVSVGIRLAEAAEQFPDLELGGCKTQVEALKKLDTFKKLIIRDARAREADTVLKSDPKKLANSYIVGDFFEKVKNIPDESMELIELDPPFGINIQQQKKYDLSYTATYGASYVEIDQLDYRDFFQRVAQECYRVAGKNSWLICWYGPEPWAEFVFTTLIAAGFDGRRLPGLWIKPNGQLHNPDIQLANASECFYYMRKGNPKIIRQGHTNLFPFSPVPPQRKIHPTERPIELMTDILNTFAIEGTRVLVPFAGSGVTLRAAFNLKMLAIGFDKTQAYKDAFVSQIMEEQKGEVNETR
jgi:ParB/RepB/Spo0J family partition protein